MTNNATVNENGQWADLLDGLKSALTWPGIAWRWLAALTWPGIAWRWLAALTWPGIAWRWSYRLSSWLLGRCLTSAAWSAGRLSGLLVAYVAGWLFGSIGVTAIVKKKKRRKKS